MKKFVILMLALTLLLCGCGGNVEPFEPVEERPPVELPEPQTVPDATVEPVTEAPETEAPTEEPAQHVLFIKDQFCETYENSYGGTYCVHIPKLVLNGDDKLTINNKIYTEHMRKLHENTDNEQPSASAAYAMGEANGYASVITAFQQQEYEFVEYSIVHVNAQTGQEATDNQILASFGYTPDSFRVDVRKAMEKLFVADNDSMRQTIGEEAYRQALSEHLSDENISTAKPFIDADGKLCFVVKFYTFAGAGYYYNRICLQMPASYPEPQTIACDEHQ